ncbi:MAG: hypothetical protein U0934_19885 [Pseudotabrizicola sp.]|uniref:hypothetical protein n=1 Tax=Pseudotabrizicola sp. TaxID=2939647 RepID=UPI002730BAAE|nr:hypothetical protein [Pseudotabrizicola sp.]MDP2082838.1 hypothetical protein [Pseudotabrizicola sp.]MDZ7576189.1 hypothetical protein [Pseudotabrizicola sp.]
MASTIKPAITKLPTRRKIADPAQSEFALQVERVVEQDGIGMGVLSDGTPFLTQRAIGDLCGLRNKYIGIISAEWAAENPPKEVRRIREMLFEQGVNVPVLPHVEVWEGAKRYLAYPDRVCTVMLEYFAFEADRRGAEIALQNYRKLLRNGLKEYIYRATGYTAPQEDDVWRIFKDRVSLTYDAVPDGYFGVFKELASLIVTLGLAGLHIDENFVPDISVGQAWSKHWSDKELMSQFGSRASYAHNYPSYFRQSASNPQIANCYPDAALGEFRRWFRQDYIGEGRFKKYLSRKVSEKLLPDGYVERAMLALTKERP